MLGESNAFFHPAFLCTKLIVLGEPPKGCGEVMTMLFSALSRQRILSMSNVWMLMSRVYGNSINNERQRGVWPHWMGFCCGTGSIFGKGLLAWRNGWIGYLVTSSRDVHNTMIIHKCCDG